MGVDRGVLENFKEEEQFPYTQMDPSTLDPTISEPEQGSKKEPLGNLTGFDDDTTEVSKTGVLNAKEPPGLCLHWSCVRIAAPNKLHCDDRKLPNVLS